MIIMLLPEFFDDIESTLESYTTNNPYIVAITKIKGIDTVVGSVRMSDRINNQATIAIWGNDSSSQETDGALPNVDINFYLVNYPYLFELEINSTDLDTYKIVSITFVDNGTLVLRKPAEVSTQLCPDCSGEGVTWGPGLGPPPAGC